MARTAIPVVAPGGPYPALPVVANSLDVLPVVADVANGNSSPFGTYARILLIVQNSNAGAQTFTIDSAPDALHREGDIGAYSLAAGEFAAFMCVRNGFRQSDGSLYYNGSHADVKFIPIGIN